MNSKSLANLKPHQFKSGFDPKRNMKGAPRGKNFRYHFGQEMYEKHKDELQQIVGNVIQKAIKGHEHSEKLCFDYFITKPVADITVENSDHDMILEDMENIPKDVLETMRRDFVGKLSKYNESERED